MKYNNSISEKMDSLVIEAIEHGYDVLDFLEDVNYSIINSILRGYIFEDYLEQSDLVDKLNCVGFCPPCDNWDELVKTALAKKGIDYDKELERIRDLNGGRRINISEKSILRCLHNSECE